MNIYYGRINGLMLYSSFKVHNYCNLLNTRFNPYFSKLATFNAIHHDAKVKIKHFANNLMIII